MAPIIRYSTANKGWTLSFILCRYDIEHAEVKAAASGSKYTKIDCECFTIILLGSLYTILSTFLLLSPKTITTTPIKDTIVNMK